MQKASIHKVMGCMAVMVSIGVAAAQSGEPLRLVQTITLPVTGKFDHMAVDPHNKRAFVAASGNSTVEVLDLEAGKWIKSIPGKGKPAGLVYSEKMDRVVYSTDAGGFRILNPNTMEIETEISLAVGADSLGLDKETQIVYVDNGGRVSKEDFSRISPVDLATHKNLGDIRIPGGKLEAITFEEKGNRAFVNDTSADKVVVFDRHQRKVLDSWEIGIAKENVPMVLNEAEHRLIIGTRQPGMLVVFDTETGKVVAHAPATGFADDLSYDTARKRIYMSGGNGAVDVYQEKDPNTYVQIQKIPTRDQARTSKWVPELNRLYVEVPGIKPGEAAEIRVFEAQN